MKRTAILLLFVLIFGATENCVGREIIFQAVAQTNPDFPVSQYVWDRTGWLIHYDWGVSGYVYLNGNNFYYMITGGSEFYMIWISVDLAASDGYQINGMYAQYVLSTIGPESHNSWDAGLHRWNSTEKRWQYVASSEGSVAFAANQGKLDLSEIGNPKKIWVILEVDEGGPIRLPQNGFAYVDVTNKFAAAFIVYREIGPISHPGSSFPPEPKSWLINRFQTANATVILKNFALNYVSSIRVNMSVPPEINVLNGTPEWMIAGLDPQQTVQRSTGINRTSFGTSFLRVSLTYSVLAQTIGPTTLQQRLTMAPRVHMNVITPQKILVWTHSYHANLTISNLEASTITITLRPGDLTLELEPFANMTLGLQFTALESNVRYTAFFEDVAVYETVLGVNINFHPNIWIIEIAVDEEPYSFGYLNMQLGRGYTVGATVWNQENTSYTVTVLLKEGGYWQEQPSGLINFMPSQQSKVVDLPPNSNTTIAFNLLAIDKPNAEKYTELSLTIELAETYQREAKILVELVSPSSPNLFLSLQAFGIYALVFVLGVLVKTAYNMVTRRKRDTASASSKCDTPLERII